MILSFKFVCVLIIFLVVRIISEAYALDCFTDDEYRRAFPNRQDAGTLKMVIVLFNHGSRTPDGSKELYPYDPHLNETYFPYGFGELTNVGKLRQYELGVDLRKRYNKFLGEYHYPEIVEAVSTDYGRTKMSLQLVLSGLFPPRTEEAILDIAWQSIPYNYLPETQDKVLMAIRCPKYTSLYNEYLNLPSTRNKFTQHEDTFQYLSKHTGLNMKTFEDIHSLYLGLYTQEEYGLPLPKWSKIVYPEPIKSLAAEHYYISMGTIEMRKILNGYFLQKLLLDIERKIKDKRKLSKKIQLYSMHENNIAQFLIALGVFKKHVPRFSSSLILELHQLKQDYGVKMYYKVAHDSGFELVKISGCQEICHLKKFKAQLKPLLPHE